MNKHAIIWANKKYKRMISRILVILRVFLLKMSRVSKIGHIKNILIIITKLKIKFSSITWIPSKIQ